LNLRSALLIGDIHTESELLAETLAFASRVEHVLSVGDIVDGSGDPVACIDQLRAVRALVVRGNHERWVCEGRPMYPYDYPDRILDWLNDLPATREFDTPAGRFLLCHGIGTNDMRELKPDTDGYALECLDDVLAPTRAYRFCVGGHTHKPMVRTIGTTTYLNPGTLVLNQDPGFMLVDFEARTVERYALLPTATMVERTQLV
jgi:predicted phosphodiesterase